MIAVMDGNDYVGVSQALAPFNALAKYTGAVPFLLHHQPKGISTGLEINVLGSEAFRAATDTLLEASKIGSIHFLRGHARGWPDLDRIRVIKAEDGMLSTDADSITGVEEAILEAFQTVDKEITKAGLIEAAPGVATFHPKSVFRALKSLSEAGKLSRVKKRGQNVYKLPLNDSGK